MCLTFRYDSGYTYNDKMGLVVSGGHWGTYMADVDRTEDGITFDTMSSLPSPTSAHSLISVDDERLFLTGGYNNMNSAYLYRCINSFTFYFYKCILSKISC